MTAYNVSSGNSSFISLGAGDTLEVFDNGTATYADVGNGGIASAFQGGKLVSAVVLAGGPRRSRACRRDGLEA